MKERTQFQLTRSLPTEMYNRGPVSIDEKEVDVDSIEMEGMDWRERS